MSWISAGISALGGIGEGLISGHYADKQNQANISFQREVAQNGVRWKVADAKAAGVNPLFALNGINGATASGGSSVTPDFSGFSSGVSKAADILAKKQTEVAESQIEANSAVAAKNRQEGEAALINASSNASNAASNRMLAVASSDRQKAETLMQSLTFNNANNFWSRIKDPKVKAEVWRYMHTPSNYLGSAGYLLSNMFSDFNNAVGSPEQNPPVVNAKQGERLIRGVNTNNLHAPSAEYWRKREERERKKNNK